MLKLPRPFPIVNLRIPGLILRETTYFVQKNTTDHLPGDTPRTTIELSVTPKLEAKLEPN